MPRRGDICDHFNSSMFRYYLRKKYKNHKVFAKRMDVSFQVVYAWETGVHKPTYKNLFKMAQIFGISPRMLIVKIKRHVLDKWEDHLLDFLHAPPEVQHETVDEEVVGDKEGSERTRRKKIERELKLSERGAIELTDKLGYFDVEADDVADEVGDAEHSDADLLEAGDVPEAYQDGVEDEEE